MKEQRARADNFIIAAEEKTTFTISSGRMHNFHSSDFVHTTYYINCIWYDTGVQQV